MRIFPHLRDVVLTAIALVVLLTNWGCNSYLARRVVTAPNLKDPIRGVDASQAILNESFVGRQLRVPVGPPNATMSVWICEPYTGLEWFHMAGAGRKIVAVFGRPTATQPTTATTHPSPLGTIFLIHGIEDHKELGPYLLYREALVQLGYRVVQVDLRGHGRSTGDWITYGVVESHDLKQVLDELSARGLVAGDVGVLGISYGASVAIEWAAIDPRIRAIVALEPFATLEDASVDAAPFVLGKLRWLYSDNDLRAALKQSGKLASFDPAAASPLAAIAQLRIPILLIHSKADELIPFKHTQRLHDANPDFTRIIPVENQSHFWMWWQSRDMIDSATGRWLDRYIAHQNPPPATNPSENVDPIKMP